MQTISSSLQLIQQMLKELIIECSKIGLNMNISAANVIIVYFLFIHRQLFPSHCFSILSVLHDSF